MTIRIRKVKGSKPKGGPIVKTSFKSTTPVSTTRSRIK